MNGRAQSILVLLFSLFALTACGGGGSSAAVSPPPPADTALDWDDDNWDQRNWQ
jgi:hypothetical protein